MDPPILIPDHRLRLAELEQFRNAPFEKMIKFVVDVRLRRIALGGEMHADAEEVLLRGGSSQVDLWGGNIWPWELPPRIEYISLINIRPAAANPSLEVRIDKVREVIKKIVHDWVELP